MELAPLLRSEDVAKLLGISRQGTYNLARSGAIRSVAFKSCGNRWTIRFRPEDVQEFIEKSLREWRGGER